MTRPAMAINYPIIMFALSVASRLPALPTVQRRWRWCVLQSDRPACGLQPRDHARARYRSPAFPRARVHRASAPARCTPEPVVRRCAVARDAILSPSGPAWLGSF